MDGRLQFKIVASMLVAHLTHASRLSAATDGPTYFGVALEGGSATPLTLNHSSYSTGNGTVYFGGELGGNEDHGWILAAGLGAWTLGGMKEADEVEGGGPRGDFAQFAIRGVHRWHRLSLWAETRVGSGTYILADGTDEEDRHSAEIIAGSIAASYTFYKGPAVSWDVFGRWGRTNVIVGSPATTDPQLVDTALGIQMLYRLGVSESETHMSLGWGCGGIHCGCFGGGDSLAYSGRFLALVGPELARGLAKVVFSALGGR